MIGWSWYWYQKGRIKWWSGGVDIDTKNVELNNDRVELILIPNDVELNNDRLELILIPKM